MFRQWLGEHGGALPLVAMILFVAIGALVVVYTLADRRRGHRLRMSAMALDDADAARVEVDRV